jgi:hypothetical protein
MFMKMFSAIVLTAFLAFVAGVYGALPWWSLAITSLIVAVAVHQRAGRAFLSGFLGLFLLWGILAFMKDAANEHVLSIKVSQLFLKNDSYLLLILVTAIVGGLVSGFAAMTGSYLRGGKRRR